jgi:hypothetical protein
MGIFLNLLYLKNSINDGHKARFEKETGAVVDTIYNCIHSSKGLNISHFSASFFSTLVVRHGLKSLLDKQARTNWLRYKLKQIG